MKIHNIIILFVSIILCIAAPLSAQSPYKTSWEKDGTICGIGGASAVTGFFLYRSVSPPTTAEVGQLSRTSVNRFDRSATYNFSTAADRTSDILFAVATAAPLLLFTDNAMREDWKIISLMYLESWSFIGAMSMLSKSSIERFRPYVYNPNVPLNEKLTSDAKMAFFSNHTTVAFASAVFISTVYSDYNPNSEWKPYIWAGSLLTASIMGYLRYEAGMHFPTDILVGALVGSAIGYMIPWMHRVDKDNISIAPGAHSAEYGFSVQVRF